MNGGLRVVLLSKQPVHEVAKGDGRARRAKRGVRKGRHMVRTRVRPGASRARWAVVEETNGVQYPVFARSFRTREDARRALARLTKALQRERAS